MQIQSQAHYPKTSKYSLFSSQLDTRSPSVCFYFAKKGGVAMKLTPKQQAFADYYIQTGNATEAAIKAGYSKKTAKETGYENLTKPHLQDYIEKKQKELASDRVADMTEVREFWTKVMRDIDSEMKDRLKASEMIAKTSGAFLNKVEMKTIGEQTITVTIMDDDDDAD